MTLQEPIDVVEKIDQHLGRFESLRNDVRLDDRVAFEYLQIEIEKDDIHVSQDRIAEIAKVRVKNWEEIDGSS